MQTTATRSPERTVDRPAASDGATWLERFVRDGVARSRAHGADYQLLWETLATASDGGKRFRPALLASVYAALGGTDRDLARRVGDAVELLHTAFLVHDDVIDGDDVRRGRPNVSGVFRAEARRTGADDDRAHAHATAAGILAGDLALVGAVRGFALCGAPAATTERLLDLLDDAVYLSAAGELADSTLGLQLGAASFDEVLTMEQHKTAAYSFQLPLQAGAVLAGAPEPWTERLGEIGRLVGIAYQLLDDVRGVFGDPASTGKPALGDIREGKHTPLMAHARTTAAWPEIAPYVGSPAVDAAGTARLRHLLTSCGSRSTVEELARRHIDTAHDLTAGLEVSPDFHRWIRALTDDFVRSAA